MRSHLGLGHLWLLPAAILLLVSVASAGVIDAPCNGCETMMASEAEGFNLHSVEPGVIRAGEPAVVTVFGEGFGADTSVFLVGGGAYQESVTRLEYPVQGYGLEVITTDQGYAFTVTPFGVVALDIRDPVSPVSMSFLPFPSTKVFMARRSALEGHRLYVARDQGIEVIDVSDPTAMKSLGFAAAGPECTMSGMAVAGPSVAVGDGVAFLSCSLWTSGSVWAFKISAAGLPSLIGRVDPFATPWETAGAIRVAGGVLFANDWTRGLIALDVSRPRHPVLLSDGGFMERRPFWGIWELVIDGGYAYNYCDLSLFCIFDVRDPRDIQLVSQRPVRMARPGGLAVQGKIGLVTNYNYTVPAIVDFSNPAAPLLDYLPLPADTSWQYPTSVAIAGHHGLRPGFVRSGSTLEAGIRTFNLQHRTRPNVLSRVDGRTAVISGRLLITNMWGTGGAGMRIYDLSDPEQPSVLGEAVMPKVQGSIRRFVVDGNLVFANAGTWDVDTIQVFDIADPSSPLYLGELTTSGSIIEKNCGEQLFDFGTVAEGLLVRQLHDDYQYHCWKHFPGIEILELVSPVQAVYRSTVSPGYFAEKADERDNVQLANGVLYVQHHEYDERTGEATQYLKAFDVSAPESPTLASRIPLQRWVTGMDAEGPWLYISDQGLKILDYSDPANPVRRGALNYGGSGLQAADGFVHLYGTRGVTTLVDVRDPDRPRVVGGDGILAVGRDGPLQVGSCHWGRHSDLCIVELTPTVTAGHLMDAGTYRIDVPDTLRPGPYHVVAWDGQTGFTRLHNAVVVQGRDGPGEEDMDGDGFLSPDDCDDTDPDVHPGAVDRPGNALDEDCNGSPSCSPQGPWLNHGRFMACVAQACRELVRDGKLAQPECGAVIGEAGTTAIGRPQSR